MPKIAVCMYFMSYMPQQQVPTSHTTCDGEAYEAYSLRERARQIIDMFGAVCMYVCWNRPNFVTASLAPGMST